MVLVILIVILLIVFLIIRKTKFLKLNNVVLVNGGVKSGKTTLTTYLAIKQHKKIHFKWWINKYVFFRKDEEPLLYSNVPLKYKYYVPFTKEILTRDKRISYKSVCLLSEASLVLDSQTYKDLDLNYQSMLFCKLYAHETKGGYLFIETQALSDLHFSFKRVLNNYVYIHSCVKWIPFILCFKVRELMYSYDNEGIVNSFNEDIEDSMKTLIIPKSIWKKFDCYTYSSFTDSLDYDCALLSKNDLEKLDLKSKDIVSFIKFKQLKKGGEKNE